MAYNALLRSVFVLPALWLAFSPCYFYATPPSSSPRPPPLAPRDSRTAPNGQEHHLTRPDAAHTPYPASALVEAKASMPSFESQSSSTSGSHSASLSTSCSSSSHSRSADIDDNDDDDTLKLKNPSATGATGAPRTYTHSVGFPRYEDLFYRPPPRTSSRAYLGLRRRNRDARVLVPPPASHIHKYGCGYDFDGGYGYGYEYGKNDDGYAYDYAYARYDPRASPGVDEQLRELMYEMRDWVVENPEEASKRLQVCLRVFVSSCFPALIFSFLFSA